MTKKSKNYFTSGEFARLCNVKKQTLFHYDEIGVLVPELVGKNGYRYYSYGQLESFATISMLKDLEMPLADIKKYMDSRSPEGFISLLEKQKKEVASKMKKLQRLQRFIDTKIDITKEGMGATVGEILLETLPEEYCIMTEYQGKNADEEIAAAVAEHLNFCHELNIYSAYSIGGIIASDNVIKKRDFSYSHFYTRIQPSDLKEAFRRPAGVYAVYYDDHGYDNLESTCIRLLEYIKNQGCRPGPYFYEELLLDEMSAIGESNYTMKLSILMIK